MWYHEIKKIGMPEMEAIDDPPQDLYPPEARLQELSQRIRKVKGHSPWLYLESVTGTRHEVQLRPGFDLFGVWNILIAAVRFDSLHPVGGRKNLKQ